MSSVADKHEINRWERHDANGLAAADNDANADGIVDKWETYQNGAVKTASFDETGDGKPDRRLSYVPDRWF